MDPTRSTYSVAADWTSGRSGITRAAGIEASIRFSSPPEFQGEPGFWTPEHFLVAAVASCFIATFAALADRANVSFGRLELSVEGKLDKIDGQLRFAEMILRPSLTVFQNKDRERAYRLLERTEHGCLIARSLNCPVLMEPLVQAAEDVLAI